MKLEYMKVGGKENYEIVQKMQISQIQDFVKQYKENPEMQKQIDGGSENTNEWPKQNDTRAPSANILTPDQIASIKKDYWVEWKKDAKITIVEYSDFECPFCIKLFKSNAIQNILAAKKDSVNYMFKHFPLPMHPNANKQHEAIECVREIAGDAKYFEFKKLIFSKAQGNNSFDNSSLWNLVKNELKLDEKKFTSCLDSGKYASKIEDSTNEGSNLFEINGTPGTVIINNETGKYEVVSWAQGQRAFEAAIDAVMN